MLNLGLIKEELIRSIPDKFIINVSSKKQLPLTFLLYLSPPLIQIYLFPFIGLKTQAHPWISEALAIIATSTWFVTSLLVRRNKSGWAHFWVIIAIMFCNLSVISMAIFSYGIAAIALGSLYIFLQLVFADGFSFTPYLLPALQLVPLGFVIAARSPFNAYFEFFVGFMSFIFFSLKTKLQRENEAMREKEKENYEAELIRNSRQASLNTLSSGIAHEINNPLAISRGYLEMMSEKFSMSGDVKQYIEKCDSALMRIEKIVKELIKYNKIAKAPPELCRLDDIIDNTLEFFVSELETDKIILNRIKNTKNSNIFASPSDIQQIVLNMLANARDAIKSSDRPEIIIKTGNPQEGLVSMEITDNGVGISEDNLKNLFDVFYTTKISRGLQGISLWATDRIISSLKGNIKVESQQGKGTSFYITFPIIEPR